MSRGPTGTITQLLDSEVPRPVMPDSPHAVGTGAKERPKRCSDRGGEGRERRSPVRSGLFTLYSHSPRVERLGGFRSWTRHASSSE